MITRLTPGQSVEYANGYVARSWATDGLSYYAECCDEIGAPLALSPRYSTFAEALAWLRSTI